MRRIAFGCLAVAALTTGILAAGTHGALATKTHSAVATKTPSALASKTHGALASKTPSAQKSKAHGTLASKTVKKHTAGAASSSDLVTEAKRWMGTNPTGWDRVWCARFMNFVLKRTGHPGTGSDAAESFASYGTRLWFPRVGAIAVMKRGKTGGHVGVVSGFDDSGNPIIISGNHNKRVGVGVYPRERVYAYVMPN